MTEKKPRTYKYIIEMSRAISPRLIADTMSMLGIFARILLRVTDLQSSEHEQGGVKSAIYTLQSEEQVEPMTFEEVHAYYDKRYHESGEETPAKDAYEYILEVLEQMGDGNMGMVTAYMREYVAVLEEFEMHCQQLGRFAEAEKEGEYNGE